MSIPPQAGRVASRKSKVLVVDDHPVVRRGLVTLINEQPDFEVCGDAGNEEDALVAFQEDAPDLLLADWSLKRRDSSGLIAALLRARPDLKVLVLSIHDEMTHAELALELGAQGYIMKREAADKIIDGLRTVAGGDVYLSQRVLSGSSRSPLVRANADTGRPAGIPSRAPAKDREPFHGWSVSIVIPVFNSRGTLPRLCDQLVSELDGLVDLQIILVDDLSTDGSREVCLEMNTKHPSTVEVLLLARNFGEHSALLAGIRHATGSYCVLMDDDLQNPPSEVKSLLRQAAKGVELVYARYARRCHPVYRQVGSLLQDWTARLVLGKPRGLYLSSFKVFNSRVAGEVCRHQGPDPYLDALLLQATSSISTVECEHRERGGGESSYTWSKLVGLWIRLLLGWSVLPLRAAAFVSLLLCGVCLFKTNDGLHGRLAWLAGASFVLLLWLLGEYAGRIQKLLLGVPQAAVMRCVRRRQPDRGNLNEFREGRFGHEAN